MESSMQRMTWSEICAREDLRGRWVAIDECRYDEVTGRATDGLVVDADDDLAELCNRVRASDLTNCAIVLAESDETPLSDSHRLSN